jgi:hypothetical protein
MISSSTQLFSSPIHFTSSIHIQCGGLCCRTSRKSDDTDGETRLAIRCRVGDRWHNNEIHFDEDGQKAERETLHDVGDADIEGFKVEWQNNRPSGNEDDRE